MATTFKDISREIQKCIDKVTDKRSMKRYAEVTENIVRRRTRLGFGVKKSGGQRQKLKPLAESYKEQRRGKLSFFTDKAGKVRPISNPKKRFPLSKSTSPGKSNLTRTGSLLDKLQGRATVGERFSVRPSTKTRPDGLTGTKVAEFVSKDRPFLDLSNNEIRQLTQLIQKELNRCIDRELT